MCEKKVSSLIYYLVFLFTFRPIATGWLQTICLLTFSYVEEKLAIFSSYEYNVNLPLVTWGGN